MGFFKNLFEKKVCDICGEEIGLLGNRKLEDGNCCKDCAKKLSPWFTERKRRSSSSWRAGRRTGRPQPPSRSPGPMAGICGC